MRLGSLGTEMVPRLAWSLSTEPYEGGKNLAGAAFKGTGVVVVFPLSALVSNSEIRVVFDRTARGFSGCRCAASAQCP